MHAARRLILADVATVEQAQEAAASGADLVATTLAGYTQAGPAPDGPDLALLAAMVRALPDVPIIAEGRYHSPALALRAIDTGAIAVVVGTAITDPAWITRQFAHALRGTSERSCAPPARAVDATMA